MAEIGTESKGDKKTRKGKARKISTRIDYTPMVDLGMLLITFFMLTTTLIRPQTMEIAMPSKQKVPESQQTEIKASRAITIILGKDDTVYYYKGTREHGVDPVVHVTDLSSGGIRRYLLQRNYDVVTKVLALEAERANTNMPEEEFEKKKSELMNNKQSPIVIIKATDDATYGELVDILDEMAICDISRYAILDINDYDLSLLKKLKA